MATGSKRSIVGLALALAALAACGPGLIDTYSTPDGQRSLSFRRDGTVYVTSFGGTFAARYELDGERIIIRGPNGSQVLLRVGDRLEAGLDTIYTLQPAATKGAVR